MNLGAVNAGYSMAMDAVNLELQYKQMQQQQAQFESTQQYNDEQAKLAWQRQLDADNSKYQRMVADMKLAGINPMLAANNSPTTPSATAASASPGPYSNYPGFRSNPIQNFLDARLAQAQIQDVEASAHLKETQASKNVEQERGEKLSNDFQQDTFEARKESIRVSNELSSKQSREINKKIDKYDAEIAKLIAETSSEEEKQRLMITQEILNNAEARNIESMRPYIIAELKARTSAEHAAAKLSAVGAAYKQGLIDAGAIEASVRAENANASVNEIKSDLESYEYALKSGTLDEKFISGPSAKVISSLFASIRLVAESTLGSIKL